MILPPFPQGLTRRNLSDIVAIDTSIIGRSFMALDVAPRGVLVGAEDPPPVGATERLRISLRNGTAIVNLESQVRVRPARCRAPGTAFLSCGARLFATACRGFGVVALSHHQ